MSYTPRISIVTPSFQQGDFIEETIRSVLNQGYPNLQYIVVDGGSTDGTLDILKKYEDRIDHWISEPDKGQSDAINKGLAHVDGDIFNWLNSDDLLAEGALEKVAWAFADPEVQVLCGHEIDFQGNFQEVERSQSRFFDRSIRDTLAFGSIVQPPTFFRKEVIDELGPLSDELDYVMDLEWWWKYFLSHGADHIRRMDDVLAYFRLHQDSKTVSGGGLFPADVLRILTSISGQLQNTPFMRSVHELLGRYFPTRGYRFEGALHSLEERDWAWIIFQRGIKLARQVHDPESFAFARNFAELTFAYRDYLDLTPQEVDELREIMDRTKFASWPLFRIRRKLNWIFGDKSW